MNNVTVYEAICFALGAQIGWYLSSPGVLGILASQPLTRLLGSLMLQVGMMYMFAMIALHVGRMFV